MLCFLLLSTAIILVLLPGLLASTNNVFADLFGKFFSKKTTGEKSTSGTGPAAESSTGHSDEGDLDLLGDAEESR